VVLFVDVIRELREPLRTLNRWLIRAIAWSPFVQDAKRRHLVWEERFDGIRGTGA
jgi:beta-hydroxylase